MSEEIDQFRNRLRERENRLKNLDTCSSPVKRYEKPSSISTTSTRNIRAQSENIHPEVEPSKMSISLKKNFFETKALESITIPEIEPSKLPLSHRKNIFERKILEEQREKLKCVSREEYLSKTKNKRVDSPPQPTNTSPQRFVSTPQPPVSIRKSNTPQPSPIVHHKVNSPSQPILSARPVNTPSRSSSSPLKKVESTSQPPLADLRTNRLSQSSPVAYQTNDSPSRQSRQSVSNRRLSFPHQQPATTEQKVSSPLQSRRIAHDANYDIEAMSLCSQTSDHGDDPLYPGLPPLEHADSIHSGSPSKHTDDDAEADASASDSEDIFHAQPVISSPGYSQDDLRRDHSIGLSTILSADEPSKSSVTTPMRTISAFRLEQKKKAEKLREEAQKSVNAKNHASEHKNLDRKRRHEIRLKISELKNKELPKLQQIVKQAAAALNICLESSEFKDTDSHADAEKHLFVNDLRKVAIMAKIDSLNAQLDSISPLTDSDQVTGTIQFNSIEVPVIRDPTFSSKKKSQKTQKDHYYFCVVSHEENVLSTDCLPLSEGLSSDGGLLRFKVPESFKFTGLRSDFVLKIDLYEIILTRQLKKDSKKVHLPHLSKKKVHESYVESLPSRPRSVLKGCVELRARNLRRKDHELQGFSYDYNLTGRIHLTLTTGANYETQYGDILDFSEDGIWRRYWCRMEGPKISMWRCFADEEAARQPIRTIDLRHCINPVIEATPFSVSSRNNSFILFLAGTHADRTRLRVNWLCHKNYVDVLEMQLVSAATEGDMEDWLNALNNLLQSFRVWDETALHPCTVEEMEIYYNSFDSNA